jgi:hypothetical protein
MDGFISLNKIIVPVEFNQIVLVIPAGRQLSEDFRQKLKWHRPLGVYRLNSGKL